MNYPHRLKQLKQIESELRKQEWFSDGWHLSLGLWPNDDEPTCAGIQLSRKGWFNEDSCGIHIESWLTDHPIEEQQVPILMHVLHKKTFPGGKEADVLSKPLVNDPEVKKLVKSWKGYKLGKGGMTPFRANKKFTEESLVAGLFEELRKTHEIGAYVDKYIEHCLSK